MNPVEVNFAWFHLINQILQFGTEVSPRGMRTKELPQRTIAVDMRFPLLTVPERRLSFQGAAAEAFWICNGDDTVDGIVPWLPRMRDFSDNGATFFGAYGPRIAQQLEYVVEKLRADPDTRQATLVTWRPNPQPTKDCPCTVAMDFKIRDGKLNMHVFMRSSDAWLGIPYDVFSFSMVAHMVCCRLNFRGWTMAKGDPPKVIEPGALYLTAASSHLYEANWAAADEVMTLSLPVKAVPAQFHLSEETLLLALRCLRNTKPGDPLRWWE
jgi:thymidylate synthase